ncbi:unnamed protein product, partial [marine sediment metagenome]
MGCYVFVEITDGSPVGDLRIRINNVRWNIEIAHSELVFGNAVLAIDNETTAKIKISGNLVIPILILLVTIFG